MSKHIFSSVALVVLAWATRIELLPVLAAVYVLASGSQWLSGWRKLAALRRENADLRWAVQPPDSPEPPGPTGARSKMDLENPNHRRSQWWLPVELAVMLWRRLLLNPLWRWVDAGDPRASRGRHATHRWVGGQIHGTVAQRRPSAAAGQQAVAAGWRDTTADQPRITDLAIHQWMAEAAVRDAIAHS